MIEVKIIADSIVHTDSKLSILAPRLTTFQLSYPRFIHAEFMTHRVFSRNASSSRAIPVANNIAAVVNNPAEPVSWGKNKPGMQAGADLEQSEAEEARRLWLEAGRMVAGYAEKLNQLKLHKQVANRILEPWLNISVVMTTTDIAGFFILRDHPDADPTIQELAKKMKHEYSSNSPTHLEYGEWHLPYVKEEEKSLELAPWISAARCARVSYNNHDGTDCDLGKDMKLARSLAESKHMSPFEHQAIYKNYVLSKVSDLYSKNNRNFSPEWVQFRALIEKGDGPGRLA